MAQLIVAMLLTVAAVVFAMSNTHHVQLSFALGAPVQMRLVFLLVLAFVAGVVVAWFHQMVTRLGRRAQRRRQQALVKRGAAREAEGE